jgi:hypothetical protein
MAYALRYSGLYLQAIRATGGPIEGKPIGLNFRSPEIQRKPPSSRPSTVPRSWPPMQARQ